MASRMVHDGEPVRVATVGVAASRRATRRMSGSFIDDRRSRTRGGRLPGCLSEMAGLSPARPVCAPPCRMVLGVSPLFRGGQLCRHGATRIRSQRPPPSSASFHPRCQRSLRAEEVPSHVVARRQPASSRRPSTGLHPQPVARRESTKPNPNSAHFVATVGFRRSYIGVHCLPPRCPVGLASFPTSFPQGKIVRSTHAVAGRTGAVRPSISRAVRSVSTMRIVYSRRRRGLICGPH